MGLALVLFALVLALLPMPRYAVALLVFSAGFSAMLAARRTAGMLEEDANTRRENLALLDSVIANSPLGISITDREGRMIRINKAFCSLLGYSEEELQNRNFRGITHPEDLAKCNANIRSLLDGEIPSFRLEKRYLKKGGGEIWAQLTSSALKDDIEEAKYVISQIEDITDRRQAEKAYLDAAARYRTLLDATSDGFWAVELETGRLVEVNDAYAAMSGFESEELRELRVSDLEANEKPEEVGEHILKVVIQGHDLFESRHRKKGGGYFDVEVSAVYEPESNLIICFLRDITERKFTENQLRLFQRVFENSGEGIMITDSENRIEKVNLAFTRLTGYRQDEVLGRNPSILSSGLQDREFYVAMWERLANEGFWQGEIWDRRKNGDTYPKWLSISAIRNEKGEAVNYIGSFADIAELKRAEIEIEKLAYHDTLTGLPNRFSLLAKLEQAIAKSRRNQTRLALMFIDLDRFKIINDTLGHHIGDMLIAQVGNRLHNCIRESDVVARLGGDEFVVLITEVASQHDVGLVAQKILKDFSQAYLIDGFSLFTTPSIGISIYPDHGDNINVIMKHADAAMYQAKSEGGNGFRYFEEAMTRKSSERLDLENGLRSALENGEFELHYQPQVSAEGKIRGLEALVRWRHPEFGLVPPDRFIPIAEETGMIQGLGKWVLEAASRQMKRWLDKGCSPMRIAINVSSQEFLQTGFPESVSGIIADVGIRPEQVELEITESAAMSHPEKIIGIMHALKEASFRLSIDDFGTGYSSLAYLKLFPIDQIKIDRSFIKDIAVDSNDMAITVSTIGLARKLGLEVVAEGVESRHQSEILFSHGCDLIQGYAFSRPIPAEEIERLLAQPILRPAAPFKGEPESLK